MITIKNGKLYQDDKEIKPEVGNSEHIKAIKTATDWEDLQPPTEEPEKEVLVEVKLEAVERELYRPRISLTCTCGERMVDVLFEDYEDEEAALDEDIDGEDLYCPSCDTEWGVRKKGNGWEAVKQ